MSDSSSGKFQSVLDFSQELTEIKKSASVIMFVTEFGYLDFLIMPYNIVFQYFLWHRVSSHFLFYSTLN